MLQFPAGAYHAPALGSQAARQAAFPGVRDSRTPIPRSSRSSCDISRCTRGPGLSALSKRHDVVTLNHSLCESEGGSREQEAEAEKYKHRDSEVTRARLRVQMEHWRRGPSALQARSGRSSWLRSRACPPSALTKSSWGASLPGARSSSPAGLPHNTRGQESQVPTATTLFQKNARQAKDQES